MHVLDKETLRNQLVTERNINKQLRRDLDVKERCYQTVMKQRDEAEIKIKELVKIIDDDIGALTAKVARKLIELDL